MQSAFFVNGSFVIRNTARTFKVGCGLRYKIINAVCNVGGRGCGICASKQCGLYSGIPHFAESVVITAWICMISVFDNVWCGHEIAVYHDKIRISVTFFAERGVVIRGSIGLVRLIRHVERQGLYALRARNQIKIKYAVILIRRKIAIKVVIRRIRAHDELTRRRKTHET